MNITTPVSNIMTKTLVVATPNMTLDKVKEIFDAHKFHHIPVVENGALKGIISRIDLYRVSHCVDLFHSKSNLELNNKLFKSLLAEEVMSSNSVVISPNEPISHAAALFHRNKFHALPVVEEGKLVGILTTYDLIAYAFENQPIMIG
jgi:CBS domain-containing protein